MMNSILKKMSHQALAEAVRAGLEANARKWALPHLRKALVGRNTGRVTALFEEALGLDFGIDELRLIYVPAEGEAGGFDGLLETLQYTRKVNDYAGPAERRYNPLWVDRADAFDGFGLEDSGHFVLAVQGPGPDGLFFDGDAVGEQIEKAESFFEAHPGTAWMTPGDYVSMAIIQERGGLGLPDQETSTRFPQYGENGFVGAADGPYVPRAYTNICGRFNLNWSDGRAHTVEKGGVRFVVRG